MIRTSVLDAVRQTSSAAGTGLVELRVVLIGFRTGLGFGS